MPRRSDKDPAKPKGRTSAYAFFVQDLKETEPDKKMDFKAFSKHCSDRWKQISDEDKEKFTKLSEEDKERYDREMASYRQREGGATNSGRKKKDSSLPKRNLSAFMFFSSENRPKIRADNPKDSLGDVAKKLGHAWKEMSNEQKKPYEKMAAKDKERYLEQVQQLKDSGRVMSKGGGASKKQQRKKPPPEEIEDDEEDEEEEEEEDEEDSSE